MKYALIPAALSTLLAWPAVAEPACAPFDQIEAKLAAEYHETRVNQGVVGDGRALLVIFASPNGGTWSAIMLNPDGIGCIAAVGHRLADPERSGACTGDWSVTQLSEHEAQVLAFISRFPSSADARKLADKLRGEARKIGLAIIRRDKRNAAASAYASWATQP